MISYCKLKSGHWGIRSDKALSRGDIVTVTKKSGDTSIETVDWEIYKSNEYCIYSIVPKLQNTKINRGRYECNDCGEDVYPGTTCWETGLTH